MSELSTPPPLTKSSAEPDPFRQFGKWFEEALATEPILPESMTLATATQEGVVSARMVLLKGFDKKGFVFFTNYESQKSRELDGNPSAALVFHWKQLARQVRINGQVTRVSAEESDAYFATRPRDSQLGAWTSPQSEVILDRESLEASYKEAEQRFQANEIPRPPFWGGFRLAPDSVEFWQGRPGRLHDRLRYRLAGEDKWIIERLAP
jgi:pyridoxamine 5'-phosphate oxidase